MSLRSVPPSPSTSLERAGVPAGKQSRPIVAQPYQRWTNRSRARRAKMNGSLSPSVLLSLRSSLSAIPPALFPHLDFGHLSLPRSPYTRRAPSVRRSVRSPLASAVVLSTLPYTLQRFNVSHGIFSPPLGFSTLSLSLSRLSAVFLSHFYSTFVLLNLFFLFLLDLVKALFRISASLFVSYSICISFKSLIQGITIKSLSTLIYF